MGAILHRNKTLASGDDCCLLSLQAALPLFFTTILQSAIIIIIKDETLNIKDFIEFSINYYHSKVYNLFLQDNNVYIPYRKKYLACS